jgi:hypothetical protein
LTICRSSWCSRISIMVFETCRVTS